MARYELSEKICRAPEDVFRFVADVRNAPKWVPGIKRIDVITDGPVGLGSKLREIRQVRQRTGSVEMEVTEFEPHERYGVSFMMGSYSASYQYRFLPEGTGTHAEFTCYVTANGLRRVLAPLIAMAMKRQDSGQMKMLKREIENER